MICFQQQTLHNTYFIGTRELTRILRITNRMQFSPSFPIYRLLKQPYGVLQLSLAVRRVIWHGVFFFTALRHPSILHTIVMNISRLPLFSLVLLYGFPNSGVA